jgi:uncharacterized membrane protein
MDSFFTFDSVAVIAIVGMAVATLLTRIGGFWMMSYVTVSPQLERFLRHTAGGVLVAIVTAAAVKGDPAMWLGLAAAIAAMLILRKSMTAIVIGMALAVALRYFVPG